MDKRLEEIPEWTIAENFLQSQANKTEETTEPVEEASSDSEPLQPEEKPQETDSLLSAAAPLQEDIPLPNAVVPPDVSGEAAAASEFTPLQESDGSDLFENLAPSSGLDNGSEDLFRGYTDDANTIRAVGETLDPEETEEDENKLNDLLNRLDISENIRRMSESAQEDIADVIERKEEQLELSSAIPTEEMEIEDMESVDLDAFSPMDADIGGSVVDTPDTGENIVSGLDPMEGLDPEENMISGLDSMEELDVGDNIISGLDSMEELDVGDNIVSGLDAADELDTENNMLTDMSGLDDLTPLDDLEDTIMPEEPVMPVDAMIPEETVMPVENVMPEEPESEPEEPAGEVVPEPKQSKIITLSEIMEQTKTTDLSEVEEPSPAMAEPEIPPAIEPELPPLPPVTPPELPPLPPVTPPEMPSAPSVLTPPPAPSHEPDVSMKPERQPLEDGYSTIGEYGKVPTINDLERKWRKIQEPEEHCEPQKAYEPEDVEQPEETYEPVKEKPRPRESANGFAYSLEDVLGANTMAAPAMKPTDIPVEEPVSRAEEGSRAERTSHTEYRVMEEPELPKPELPKPKNDFPRTVAATVVEEPERRVYHVHSEEIVRKTGAGKRSYYKILL